jgi:hypothetical protein
MTTAAIRSGFSVAGYPAKATPTKEGLRMSDVAQRMWRPMLAMGAMLLLAGIVLGIVSGIRADEYFGLSASTIATAPADGGIVADRAFHEAVSNGFLPPVLFLGLGFLLSGVTFLLATILGTLRDGGREIQRAVGSTSVDLAKPLTAKLFPPVMMMGLMVLIAAVVVGVIVGVDQSNYWQHASSEVVPVPQTAELSSDLSAIQSIRSWLQPLDFVGMGLILTGIILALATIVRALRFQAGRVVQLASEATEARS